MDALSETLRVVRLVGAIFIQAKFSAPWCYLSPRADTAAPVLEPGAEQPARRDAVAGAAEFARHVAGDLHAVGVMGCDARAALPLCGGGRVVVHAHVGTALQDSDGALQGFG
jgi:hypothetical protein